MTQAADGYFRQFGHWPSAAAAAPARVNLIGEHTDYNLGLALPFAIGLDAVVVAGLRPADSLVDPAVIRVYSTRFSEVAVFRQLDPSQSGAEDCLAGHPASPAWARLIQGVVSCLGLPHGSSPGIDLLVDSGIPAGSGLSSSAAVSVATCLAFGALNGRPRDGWAVARICQRAEQEFLGVPCGLMDQLASVFGQPGQLLLIDFDAARIEQVPFQGDAALMLVDCGVRHRLAESQYSARREDCRRAAVALALPSLRAVESIEAVKSDKRLDARLYRRLRHVVTENARVQAAAGALRHSDWNALGSLLLASHCSLRDDYEVSCPELDRLVVAARTAGPVGGVFGARLTGGGFGGCVLHLVANNRVTEFCERIGLLRQSTGQQVGEPLQVWPSAGAATCRLGDSGQRASAWEPAGFGHAEAL